MYLSIYLQVFFSVYFLSLHLSPSALSAFSQGSLSILYFYFIFLLFFHRFICLHTIAGSFSLENTHPHFLTFFLLSGQLCLMSSASLTTPSFSLHLLSPFPPFFFNVFWLNKISDVYERPEFPIMFE